MNVLKPFDDCFLSNEDAIRDLEDCVGLDDIVNVNGFEVVRGDYDAVHAVIPNYDFGYFFDYSRLGFAEKRVDYLRLSDLGIGSFSEEVGRLTELRILYLSHNNLSVLPPEIGMLTKLEKLYLHYNKLNSLPFEIGKLTGLQALYLQFNQLTSLPSELCDLSNLNVLYVNNNPLSDYSVVNKLSEKGVKVVLR